MLRAHQIEPARHLLDLLSAGSVAIDASDTGTGKTFVAAWVASQLRLPTLCVVPKISVSAWHAAAAAFKDTVSVIGYEKLRAGNTPFGWWDNPARGPREIYFQCTHCQRKYKPGEDFGDCYCRPDKTHCFETRKIAHRYGKFNFHPAIKFVTYDEIHRVGALDSLNSELLIAAKRQGLKILGLSATLALSPLNLRALGYALDLHQLHNYPTWAARYKCRRIPGCGMKWLCGESEQKQIMANIRASIIPARGVRVTTDSIPNFPKCDISAELYDMDSGGQLDSLYAEMADALEALSKRQESDKSADHPLTIILRARQKIELLKVPVMTELWADCRAKGFSVAMFVNFSQTVAELRKRLRTDCIVDGSPEGIAHRDKNIANFQSNSSREIILNSAAGGACINLQDLHGDFPRGGLVMPLHSATLFRQLVGRLPRDGGRSPVWYRVLFAAGTCEVRMHRALRAKLNNLDALNDLDLSPNNLSLT